MSSGVPVESTKSVGPRVKLSIVFVNWNSVDYLRGCISSILQHTRNTPFEIIVVDNASPKGGVEVIPQEFPGVRLIQSQENLGFSRANNLGFRHSSGEYVLFLNPDIKLLNPAIDIMLDAIESLPNAGIVGCRLLNDDLTVQMSAIQRFPTILNQLLDIDYLQMRWPSFRLWSLGPLFDKSASPTPVDMISGACLLMRSDTFEKVGGFSEDYFMYAEDIDLNYRTAAAGAQNYYVGAAEMIHYGGRSSTQQKVNQWATMMKYRSMQRFYINHHGRLYALMYRGAMGAVAVARIVVLLIARPLGGDSTHRKTAIQNAASKWKAVLRWAVGLDGLALSATAKRG